MADTDFKIPKEAIAAMRNVLDRGVFGYGDLPQERLSTAVQGWYARRFDTQIEKDWVVHAPGLMTGALWLILQAYTRPGDKVLVQSPVYNTSQIFLPETTSIPSICQTVILSFQHTKTAIKHIFNIYTLWLFILIIYHLPAYVPSSNYLIAPTGQTSLHAPQF